MTPDGQALIDAIVEQRNAALNAAAQATAYARTLEARVKSLESAAHAIKDHEEAMRTGILPSMDMQRS